MKIDTTINIKCVVIDRIDATARKFSVSRSKLVSLLLKRMVEGKTTDKNRFFRVKYQKRDKNAVWKRPHVMLEPDLYEKSLDMRKLYKMSVSYIVLVAYRKYFDAVVQELKNGDSTDKNRQNYICIGKRYGTVFSYIVFWDYPPEEELIKILESPEYTDNNT